VYRELQEARAREYVLQEQVKELRKLAGQLRRTIAKQKAELRERRILPVQL
jgi:hypothetical protein